MKPSDEPLGVSKETVTIERADLQDREALCKLYHEFHEFHVRGNPDRLLSLGDPPDTYEHSDLYLALEKIITDDEAAILVAKVAGQAIGLAEVYIRQDEPNALRVPYRYGQLQSLIVREAFRRRSIGTKLLKKAQQWTKGQGATEMRLEIWEFEEGPLHFYEKNDYQMLRRTLVRKLDTEAT